MRFSHPAYPMKAAFLFTCLLLPLVASAQQTVTPTPPITYHVGLKKAPLYHKADTTSKPSLFIPSLGEVTVIGQALPNWVVVKHEGFSYFTPVRLLSDYDPSDADPLPIDPQTNLITYEGVVPVPSASKADLYARAQAWATRTYNLANAEITQQPNQDPETSELLIKGKRPAVVRNTYNNVLRSTYAGVVHYTLTIYVKDGRYKYILSDLTHDAAGTANIKSGGPLEQDKANLFGYVGLGSTKPWRDLKVEATRDVRHLVADLQAAMTLTAATPPTPAPKAKKAASDF
jgi:hypothetical protein